MEEAEERTGLSRTVILRAVRRDDVPSYRPGGSAKSRLYFDPNDLDEWKENMKVSKKELHRDEIGKAKAVLANAANARRMQLQAMDRKQLVQLCRENGLKATKGKPNAELIEFILEAEFESEGAA